MGAVKAVVTARLDAAYRLGRSQGDSDASRVIRTGEAARTCLRLAGLEVWEDRYGPSDTPIVSDRDAYELVARVVGSEGYWSADSVYRSDYERHEITTAYESAYVEAYRDRVWSDALRLSKGHKPI